MAGYRALGVPELVSACLGGAVVPGLPGLVSLHWWVRLVLALVLAHWGWGHVPGSLAAGPWGCAGVLGWILCLLVIRTNLRAAVGSGA